MRRLSTSLLLLCTVLLLACGDGEDNVSERSSGDTSAATASTSAEAQASAAGCRKVAEPKPKKAGGRKKPKLTIDRRKRYTAVLKTSCGDIRIKLAAREAPKTVNSFVSLARDDFFDGLTFHRIVPGFVAQGGDPKGTGLGGPGYKVVEAPPERLTYTRGVVAMAKAGNDPPGASGSQFFIVTAPDAGLPPEYALLGRVEGSKEAVDRLGEVPNDPADNRPLEPVVIDDVVVTSR